MNTSIRALAVAVSTGVVAAAFLAAPAGAGSTTYPIVTSETPRNSFLVNKDLSLTVQWSATDPDGVQTYWSQLTTKSHQTESYDRFGFAEVGAGAGETQQEVSIGPGWTGCLIVGADDTMDTRGYIKFNDIPCFASPVDDIDILKSKGWNEGFARGSYLNTISTTKKQGETMSFRGAYFTHLALVVTKGPDYGKIRVTDDDGFLDETYSLAATEIKKKTLIKVPIPQEVVDGQPDTSITIRVLSNDKPVKIDGVAALDRHLPI